MGSLEKFEQSVYIDECILTFCNFFDDHLKRFSNVFIFTQDNSHIMLHPVLRAPIERTKAVGLCYRMFWFAQVPICLHLFVVCYIVETFWSSSFFFSELVFVLLVNYY